MKKMKVTLTFVYDDDDEVFDASL